MRLKKPHLRIEKLQFTKKFVMKCKDDLTVLDEDDYGSEEDYDTSDACYLLRKVQWAYFQTYDTNLKIYKTLKVQFLEILENEERFSKHSQKLMSFHRTITNIIKSDLVLRIYDYYFFAVNQDGSLPIIFVIEQEYVTQTLKNYFNLEWIEQTSELINHKTKCFNYLQKKLSPLEQKYSLYEREQYYVIRNQDNTYTVKLNPLNPTLFGVEQSEMDENTQIYSEQEITIYYQIEDNLFEDSTHSDFKEITYDMIEEQNETIGNGCVQEDNYNGILQQPLQGSDIIFKFSNNPIKQSNLISQLKQQHPILLVHHDLSLFQIISQHPKFDNFELQESNESSFIFSIVYYNTNKSKSFLKCEKYESVIEAERVNQQYLQLYQKDQRCFLPLIEHELILLENCAYLLCVEEDPEGYGQLIISISGLNCLLSQQRVFQYSNVNQIQLLRKNLLIWLIEQEEYFLSLNIKIPSVFQLGITIILNESDFNQSQFYLQNPFFLSRKLIHQNDQLGQNGQQISKESLENIKEIAKLTTAYFQNKQMSEDLQQTLIQFAKRQCLKRQSIMNHSFLKSNFAKFKQIQEFTANYPQLNLELSERYEIVLIASKNIDLFKMKSEIIQEIFKKGGFAFQTKNGVNLLLRTLQETPKLNKITFIENYSNPPQHNMNQQITLTEFFADTPALELFITDVSKSEQENIQFEKLEKLEDISFTIRQSYSYDFKFSCYSKAVKNIFGVFKNKKLKKILLDKYTLFGFNREACTKSLIELSSLRNQKATVKFEPNKSFEDFFTTRKNQNEMVAEETMDYTKSSNVKSQKNIQKSKKQDSMDVELEGIGHRDSSNEKEDLRSQILRILQQNKQLTCNTKLDNSRNNMILSVIFSQKANPKQEYLDIQLKLNEKGKLQLEQFNTRYSKRLLSRCKHHLYNAQDLQKLVGDWVIIEKQISLTQECFETEAVLDCIHCDENEIIKNTYKDQHSLNQLTLWLSFCNQVSLSLQSDKNYLCLEQLPQLQTLILIVENGQMTTGIAYELANSIASRQNIKIVKLLFIQNDPMCEFQQSKIQQHFLKLPYLVSLPRKQTDYANYQKYCS